jgi:hypothetical protein
MLFNAVSLVAEQIQAQSRRRHEIYATRFPWCWSMNNSINPKPEAAIASASLYMPSPQYNYRYSGSPQFVTCVDHFLGIKLGVFHASLSRPKSRDSVYCVLVRPHEPLLLQILCGLNESGRNSCMHKNPPAESVFISLILWRCVFLLCFSHLPEPTQTCFKVDVLSLRRFLSKVDVHGPQSDKDPRDRDGMRLESSAGPQKPASRLWVASDLIPGCRSRSRCVSFSSPWRLRNV